MQWCIHPSIHPFIQYWIRCSHVLVGIWPASSKRLSSASLKAGAVKWRSTLDLLSDFSSFLREDVWFLCTRPQKIQGRSPIFTAFNMVIFPWKKPTGTITSRFALRAMAPRCLTAMADAMEPRRCQVDRRCHGNQKMPSHSRIDIFLECELHGNFEWEHWNKKSVYHDTNWDRIQIISQSMADIPI